MSHADTHTFDLGQQYVLFTSMVDNIEPVKSLDPHSHSGVIPCF